MTNAYRGEVSLTVDGEPYNLRLSLGALASLESRLGSKGLLPLIERFEAGEFSAADLIELLFAGLSGSAWQGSKEDLEKAEIEGGVLAAAKAAGEMLAASFGLPE